MSISAVCAVAEVYEAEGEDEGYQENGCENKLAAVSPKTSRSIWSTYSGK